MRLGRRTKTDITNLTVALLNFPNAPNTADYERILSNGEMVVTWSIQKYWQNNPSQWHFVYNISHMHWPRIETSPPRWETSDWTPQPGYGQYETSNSRNQCHLYHHPTEFQMLKAQINKTTASCVVKPPPPPPWWWRQWGPVLCASMTDTLHRVTPPFSTFPHARNRYFRLTGWGCRWVSGCPSFDDRLTFFSRFIDLEPWNMKATRSPKRPEPLPQRRIVISQGN